MTVIDGGLLDELLAKTSRTFALAIPLLPPELRREVGVGYLLFRIADTLEDAERWGRDERIDELNRFIEALQQSGGAGPAALARRWAARPPSTSADYNRLMTHAAEAAAAAADLDSAAQQIILRHTVASAEGMTATLAKADEAGAFGLASLDELRRYCYFVAGIVGEMLTELFRRRLAPSPAADALGDHARAFGEGLQLVNILKDAGDDAADGRTYLPAGVDRGEVIALAREDLRQAARYAELLAEAGAEGGVVAFATLPRTLAEATLDAIAEGVATKIDRAAVAGLLAEAQSLVNRQA